MTVRSQLHLADKNLNHVVKRTGVSFASQEPDTNHFVLPLLVRAGRTALTCSNWHCFMNWLVLRTLLGPVRVEAEVGRDGGCVRAGG